MLLICFRDFGASMSIPNYFLSAHPNYFPDNFGENTEE